jgi:hypothetical protein
MNGFLQLIVSFNEFLVQAIDLIAAYEPTMPCRGSSADQAIVPPVQAIEPTD